jgi:hypothetical protein
MKAYGLKRARNMCLCCTSFAKQKKVANKKRARAKAKEEIGHNEHR